MARTIEEIDAELAEVDKQIALRNAMGYKYAQAKAILDHDTSGLERIYSAMETARQNKLNRESAEKMHNAAKAEADDETRDQIVKELNTAVAIWNDSSNNANLSESDKARARENVKYWQSRADKKGVSYVPVKFDNANATGATQEATPKSIRSWKQIAADAERIAATEGIDPAEIDKIREEAYGYRGNDYTAGEANSLIAKLDNRKKTDADKKAELAWDTKKNEVEAALKADNKDELKKLQSELGQFSDRKDFATTKQKVDKALKPKKVDTTLKDWVKNNIGRAQVMMESAKKGSKLNTDGKVSFTQTINGKNYAYGFAKTLNGVDVVDAKGNVLKRFSKKDLDLENDQKTEQAPTQPSTTDWSKVLGGGW